MKKLVRAIAAAGTVAMLGAVILPLTTYAATSLTKVQVSVETECEIGGEAGSGGAQTLDIPMSASIGWYGVANSDDLTGPSGSEVPGDNVEVVCNNDSWTLTEQINSGSTINLVGETNTVDGFTPYVSGTSATASDFADNTWGMKYAQVSAVTGNQVCTTPAVAPCVADATAWHAVPANGSPRIIASGIATAGYEVKQTFGAKSDGTTPADVYSSVILYTLTGVDTP
ncbi:hypothetical protein FWD20_03755 [Candidatus Saccharibacteria bacterium]|nr:hypothetical protein [Candidatus Saccharibacteria bacterium]